MWMHTLVGLGAMLGLSGGLAAATLAQSHGHGQPAHQAAPPAHGHGQPAHGQSMQGGGPKATGSAPVRQPVRITSEELHALGGVPPGWRFTVPPGDAAKGRGVFANLECNKCHVVKGDFPEPSREPGNAGPELTGMGSHHPPEYFAQSVLDPNAVIVKGPGHTGQDGLSIMPSFADNLTVPELLDLVAYLASLTDGGAGHHGAGSGEREQVVGDYRIRVAYHSQAGGGTHDHGAKAQPGHGTPAPSAPKAGDAKPHAHDHLMVFVTDARTAEPLPYLPVTVMIHVDKAPPRTVKLGPMVGSQGFHYGADVSLPARTTKLTVTIGPTTMKVMPSAAGRFAGTARATFDWPR